MKGFTKDAWETIIANDLPDEYDVAAHSKADGVLPCSPAQVESLYWELCHAQDPRKGNKSVGIGTVRTARHAERPRGAGRKAVCYDIALSSSCGQSASALLRKPKPSCSRSNPCGLRTTDEGRRGDGNEGKVPAFGLAWWQGEQKLGASVGRKRRESDSHLKTPCPSTLTADGRFARISLQFVPSPALSCDFPQGGG